MKLFSQYDCSRVTEETTKTVMVGWKYKKGKKEGEHPKIMEDDSQ